jgi:predicted DNA-binding helix-hairpin-helix protein
MDAEGKLALIATQMHLEPAEEVATLPPPPGPERPVARPAKKPGMTLAEGLARVPGPNQVAACGHSPAELRAAVEAGVMETLTQGRGNPGRALDAKRNSLGIFEAAMPGGKRAPLLKTLLTSACERNCYYCPFRAGRDYRRATFKPEEMAAVFHQMHRGSLVQGLFLSSGIAGGGVRTQDKLLDTAEILRRKHNYTGYLHLKIMPGAQRDQVLRAMQLSDRISINLEAPNTERLATLAPRKTFIEELLKPLQWAEEIRRTQPGHLGYKGRWPSTVTQFVVGAVGESDLEILSTTAYLTRQLRLARSYFSAFSPVPDTPLENQAPENPWREHRLYQASFLFRDYGFDLEDMPFNPQGNLPLDTDPKLAWAEANLAERPVELNRAERRELLRVPGIGLKGAEAILAARRQGRLRDLRDLQKIGVLAARAAPFVLLDGRRPGRQLALW